MERQSVSAQDGEMESEKKIVEELRQQILNMHEHLSSIFENLKFSICAWKVVDRAFLRFSQGAAGTKLRLTTFSSWI